VSSLPRTAGCRKLVTSRQIWRPCSTACGALENPTAERPRAVTPSMVGLLDASDQCVFEITETGLRYRDRA
jgi:hypothetical protein